MSKRRVAGVALVALVVASIALLLIDPGPGGLRGDADTVALVRLAGPIQEAGSMSLLGGGAITPELVRERLDSAADSPSTKAIVLRVDSPGGTVGASQEIAGMIRRAPDPVVVSMGDVAASGGYYIASQADAIVAQPGTLTGSIGVIWSTLDPSGLFRKLGIEIDAVTAGEHKDMLLPGRFTPERRRIVQRLVDTMYGQFVTAVAEGRDMPLERVRELATGQLYTGEQAQSSGLVDRLGGLEEAISEAERIAGLDDASVVEMSPTLLEQLFSAAGPAGERALVDGAGIEQRLALLRELLVDFVEPRYHL
jgi:protease-4